MSLLGKETSLNSLRVFETSARHLSFTSAARELRSTQSAVSQQIRILEKQLGFLLFERIYRGVKLTKAGHELFASVQEGFETIGRTIERLQHQKDHLNVTILTDFSFAAYWLMPRLPSFREKFPDIDVRIVTNQGVLDWRNQEADIAIVFCDNLAFSKNLDPNKAVMLFREEVFPICSPMFIQQQGSVKDLLGLSKLSLLTLTAEQGQSWLDWPKYFFQKGATYYHSSSELVFNNYTLLIQAAIAGQGVGIGWRGLVDDLLNKNLLVEIPCLNACTSNGYGLIDTNPSSPNEAKQAFWGWVIENIKQQS